MLLGPVDSRDLPIGHVPDECVRKRVLGVALDRRAPLAADELPPSESVERLLELVGRAAADRRQRSGPEHLAHNRCILEQRLLVFRERVEPRGNQPVDGLGQRQLAVCALSRDPREFLSVERVAAGALEQSGLNLGRKNRAVEELMEQLRRFVLGERRKRDRRGVRLAAAPSRTTREQLGPGGGDDEERDGTRPVDEIVDEVEQALVRPVQVFEHEDERIELGEPFEETPPGGEALRAAIRAELPWVAETTERSELTPHPFRFLRIGHCFVDDHLELGVRALLRLALEYSSVSLEDLAEGPESAFTVGKTPALSPIDEVRLGLHRCEELVHEPALPDPGNTDERQQLRSILASHSSQ